MDARASADASLWHFRGQRMPSCKKWGLNVSWKGPGLVILTALLLLSLPFYAGFQVTQLPTTHRLNGAVMTAVRRRREIGCAVNVLGGSKRTSESAFGQRLEQEILMQLLHSVPGRSIMHPYSMAYLCFRKEALHPGLSE